MAGDRIRYETALDAWRNNFDSGNFSVPREHGAVAVLVPYVEHKNIDRDQDEQLPSLEREAFDVADMVTEQGRKAQVAINAKSADFETVLSETSISDIVLIGHGCLSSVEVDNPNKENRLDWEDLSKMATHLKTGRFIQRVCSTLPRDLNVPLGLMVVNDHRNVRALVGQRVTNDSLDKFGDTELLPVTNLPKMEYEDIKKEFPKRKLSAASRAHVRLGAIKAQLSRIR